MGKIYKDQTVVIELTANEELQGKGTTVIRYFSPDGNQGVFDTGLNVTGSTVKKITTLPQAGTYIFWLYTVFNDGSKLPSEPVQLRVFKEGQ